MKFEIYFLPILLVVSSKIKATGSEDENNFQNVYDQNLYKEVLDPEQCEDQMKIVRTNFGLLFEFFDAGARIPRGILKGNMMDLGNYYQCLEINNNVRSTDIQGKFCKISVPLEQNTFTLPISSEWSKSTWPEIPWQELNPNTSRLSRDTVRKIKKFNMLKHHARSLTSLNFGAEEIRSNRSSQLPDVEFTLAICIPRPCTTEDFFTNLIPKFKALGLEFNEEYCRLPGDKRWVAGDYTAIVIFSIILIVTTISTLYDIRQNVVLKRDSKSVSKLYQSFSVYTNTRRLFSYKPVPGTLECLDGIRSLAMIWVIVGHTFVMQLVAFNMANPLDAYDWMTAFTSLWITAGTITVDTFFTLSGLLLIYTTAGKLTKSKLIKNLHLFYLNRILRLFPILAAVILLQVSFFNRLSDGPHWDGMANLTQSCRDYWWSTLLYIQNYYNRSSSMCLPHSWYLAIDFQLFFISPLILYWVVSGRKIIAWPVLFGSLLIVLVASTIYNFIMEFPSATITLSRPDDSSYYMQNYYFNTLTRCPPFFVGMLFGYLLHLCRNKKIVIPKIQVALLWFLSLGLLTAIICTTYPIIQADWANQTADSIINSYMRPTWAMCLGWIIFACVHGYGGPVNWLLSLRMFKSLSRLSYAMYIIHYSIIFMVDSSALAPVHFNVEHSMHKFLVHFGLTTISAFIVTVIVDSPCSTLTKIFLGGSKPPQKTKQDPATNGKTEDLSNNITNVNNEIYKSQL